MSETPNLGPSKEKIKRAQTKFGYLKTAIHTYIEGRPYSIRMETHGYSRYVIARLEEEFPDDIAFELVEAVGHLRSALDKAVIALVAINGRGVSGIGFPFGGATNGQPDHFPSVRMENGIKKKLSADQWKLIETYRPYPGGNDLLWSINQISNADKHWKGLVSVKAGIAPKKIAFGQTDDSFSADYWGRLPEDDPLFCDKERETVLLVFKGFRGKLSLNYEPTAEIVFGEIAPVSGKNILTTLNEQIGITDRMIKDFEAPFL